MEYHDGAPRSGLPGAWDRLVGPGATVSENAGTVVTAVLGTGIWLADGASVRDWGIMRRAGAALMGAELFGGVRANTTPSATRWYHGRGQGVREMLGFSSLHLHPFLVAAFYRERDWGFALGNYAYLLVATAATAGSPHRRGGWSPWSYAASRCGSTPWCGARRRASDGSPRTSFSSCW